MGNSDETLKKVTKVVTTHTYGNRRWMAVVQGQDVLDLQRCIDTYAAFPLIKTIGLPRLLLDQFTHDIRLNLAKWAVEQFPNRFDVHLLGTNPKWIREAMFVAKYAPFVRSVDTSMPYNYAIQNLKLDVAAKDRTIVARHASYFARNWRPCVDMGLVRHNEHVMKAWTEQTLP
jgi:hypothetical protein